MDFVMIVVMRDPIVTGVNWFGVLDGEFPFCGAFRMDHHHQMSEYGNHAFF